MLIMLENRLFFIFFSIIFRVLLDVCYRYFVYPMYGYLGFGYDFFISYYALSWLVYIAALSITPHLMKRVSDYFIASFLLSVIAPLSSIVGLSSAGVFPLVVMFFVLLFFIIFQHGNLLARLMPVPCLIKISEGRLLSVSIAFVAVSVLIAWYFYTGAVDYFNLNLLRVYEFREASADLANIGLMSYFNGWVYGVFSIFLMSYFLFERKYFHFFIFFVVQIFFFGVSAHKSVLLFPVLILGLWFYFKRTRALAVVPIGFSFIIGCSLFFFLVFDHVIVGSLFIRRVFFVPAKLTLDYFSFFSFNDFVWWSNSILEGLITYPYDSPVSREIGEFNGNGSNANNGFIPSGFAHAGLLGVAIYTLIFAYFLKILDSVVMNSDVPVWLALCMTIVPLRSALISSDLFTSMLTHGLALSLIMLLLFRRSCFRYCPKGSCVKHV